MQIKAGIERKDSIQLIQFIKKLLSETGVEVLRSILVQLEFSWLVRDYDDRLGVPFRHCLHVHQRFTPSQRSHFVKEKTKLMYSRLAIVLQ